jgi:hypothetical protein
MVWYHRTFTSELREMGLVSLQQCDSVAIYDAIMQIKRLRTWTGRFIYEVGTY